MCDALLQVAGSWSRFCLLPEYWRFLTCVMQLRGRHRVDGVRCPKFDFHTALDVQFDSLPPRHDIDVGDVGLVELLGVRAPEQDRVVSGGAGEDCGRGGSTLDDLRESVETLESVAPLWKRVFGEAQPETPRVELALEDAREALAAASEQHNYSPHGGTWLGGLARSKQSS